MKGRYYLIKGKSIITEGVSRVKVLIELEDYVGIAYSSSRYDDDFGMITYMSKLEFAEAIVKDLGTNPEWSPDEITDDFTRSIS